MAKMCQSVVLQNGKEGTFITQTQKNQVLCKMMNYSKITDEVFELGNAVDFDAAVDKKGDIHIVMTDEKGNMIYVRKSKERWIRGVVKDNLGAENIFVFPLDEGIIVFYGSEKTLYCQKISQEIQDPYMIDKTADEETFHVVQKEDGDFLIIYINEEKKELGSRRSAGKSEVWQDFQPISQGGEVKHIFATDHGGDVLVCYKAMDEIKFVKIGESSQQSLTRRHTGRAQCPVIMTAGDGIKLCWLCDGRIFSSERKEGNSRWQRLEENRISDVEQVGIFKFCTTRTSYKIGFVKNGYVCIWGEEKEIFANPKPQNADQNKIEKIFEEIKVIHSRIEELNNKIDTMKKVVMISPSKKAVEKAGKTNLVKINKK